MIKKATGVSEFLNKSFNTYDLDGKWADSFGQPEKGFIATVYGESGNGKTEFCIQFAKYLSTFDKVLYASYEQGISKSLQDSIKRNRLEENKGDIFFIAKEPFETLVSRLQQKQSARIVFLDSLDYMNLTTMQMKRLILLFPTKSFIVVCWGKGDSPKSQYGKDIEFISDIKLQVKNYKIIPRSRFGGNQPFVIWDRVSKSKVGSQMSLSI
jgi:hypothetical protein